MPLYLRKSVRAGPFRFNLSKSGVGLSVGVRGFRIGTGPRGHYISAGQGGIYYRASIGHTADRKAVAVLKPSAEREATVYPTSGVDMVEIESSDVVAMRDEAFGSILDEINGKQRQARMSLVLPCLNILAGVIIAYIGLREAELVAVSLLISSWLIGIWVDSYRRATVLFYNLTEETERAFQNVTASFDGLMNCSAKWHVEAGGAVRDLTTWKRNAGATYIVKKKPTRLVYKLPKVVKSNITPPAIHVGKQIIYFFPDIVLIEDGNRFGAVGYKDLRVVWQNSNFIEEGKVPSDTKVISYTWQHPNKKGGPDRRFRDNRQVPVCQYEAMHISSASGVNELVEFSRTGLSHAFASAVTTLPKQSVSESLALTSGS